MSTILSKKKQEKIQGEVNFPTCKNSFWIVFRSCLQTARTAATWPWLELGRQKAGSQRRGATEKISDVQRDHSALFEAVFAPDPLLLVPWRSQDPSIKGKLDENRTLLLGSGSHRGISLASHPNCSQAVCSVFRAQGLSRCLSSLVKSRLMSLSSVVPRMSRRAPLFSYAPIYLDITHPR